MEHGAENTISWTSRFVLICANIFIPKWCILFFGAFIAILGFSIGALMFKELTVASKIISFVSGVIGACILVYALTLFKASENSEEPFLELRRGKFHINGREAGTLERNQAIRRDPEKLAEFWEPSVRANYIRQPSVHSIRLNGIFTNMCSICACNKHKLREDQEDAKSVASNASEITVLEDLIAD